MTTKETTTEASLLQKQAEGLWKLGNALDGDVIRFIRYTERADNPPNTTYIELAEETLAQIEDAIKRYREGKPQIYEYPQKKE